MLLISIICSEVFTLLLNTLQSIIWWKKVSSDLLLIGTIDAFVVSLVVTSFMLYIMRFSLGILFEKEALEREMIDRTKAEEALRLSESKYRNLIENIEEKHFIYSHNVDGIFTYISPSITNILGYSQEDFCTHYTRYLTDDPVNREVELHAEQSIRGVKQPPYEAEIYHKNGEIRWLELSEAPTFDQEGRVTAVQGIAQDITDRKKTDEALQQSEQRYRSLLDNAPDVIYSLTSEGIISSLSPSFERITGFERVDFIGKNFINIVHPDDRAFAIEQFRRILGGESRSMFELRSLSKSGAYLVGEFLATPQTKDGEVVGILGIARDITGRKQMEEEKEKLIRELQELIAKVSRSQREWQETVDSITDVIFLSDLDFTITRVNRTAEKVLVMPLKQILGKKCHELIHGAAMCPDFCYGCATAKTEKMTVAEMYEPHLNRYIEVMVIPRFDKQDQLLGLIHVIRDLTEHKKLEEQLAQAQKMEAVGQLAGGVAHDFNNILTSIIGCGNLLQMKLGRETPLATYINYILDASHKGASLVRGLLAFSRKDMSYPAPLDLNETIRELELFVRRTVTEDIELRMDLSDEVMTVVADKTQMGQVLINLVANARDAMPAGGLVHVTTGRFELEREFAQLYGSLAPGVYARMSVSDSGTGMDEKTRERIFDPFFTTKEVGKGTGLGLSIVYGIIKQHNGHIMVDSTQGIGTTVHMYLPIVRADGDREEAKELPFVRGGNETILFAEDDSIVRNIVKELLQEFGYEVIEAADGEDAVHKFIEHRDRISLSVLDVIMPGMNGKEAYDRIRSLQPGAKTLFMSGYASDILQSRFIHEDGLHFLQKPVSPVNLLAKIRQLLDM